MTYAMANTPTTPGTDNSLVARFLRGVSDVLPPTSPLPDDPAGVRIAKAGRAVGKTVADVGIGYGKSLTKSMHAYGQALANDIIAGYQGNVTEQSSKDLMDQVNRNMAAAQKTKNPEVRKLLITKANQMVRTVRSEEEQRIRQNQQGLEGVLRAAPAAVIDTSLTLLGAGTGAGVGAKAFKYAGLGVTKQLGQAALLSGALGGAFSALGGKDVAEGVGEGMAGGLKALGVTRYTTPTINGLVGLSTSKLAPHVAPIVKSLSGTILSGAGNMAEDELVARLNRTSPEAADRLLSFFIGAGLYGLQTRGKNAPDIRDWEDLKASLTKDLSPAEAEKVRAVFRDHEGALRYKDSGEFAPKEKDQGTIDVRKMTDRFLQAHKDDPAIDPTTGEKTTLGKYMEKYRKMVRQRGFLNLGEDAAPGDVIKTPEGTEPAPGEPAMYRGGKTAYGEFDPTKAGTGEGSNLYGKGLYATDNPDIAAFYAGSASGGEGGVVSQVKPKGDLNFWEIDSTPKDLVNDVPYMKKLGFTDEEIAKVRIPTGGVAETDTAALTAILKDKGYDGIKFPADQVQATGKYAGSSNYLIFDPAKAALSQANSGPLPASTKPPSGPETAGNAGNGQPPGGGSVPPGGEPPPPGGSGDVSGFLSTGGRKLESGGGEYNLKSLNTTEDVATLIEQVAKENDDAMKAGRRGTITFEETRKAADMLGVDLKKVGPGKTLNAEQLVAAGDILKTQAEKTQQLRQAMEAARGTPTEARAKLEYLESLQTMSAVQAKVLGAESETGRALNAIKIIRQSLDDPSVATTKKIYKMFGGEGNVDEIITRYNDLVTNQGPEAGYQYLRSMQKANFLDKIEWYWYNSILSGTKTHIRNTIGNIVGLVGMPVEAAATGVAETVVAPLEGRPRQAYAGEGMAELYGVRQGLDDGWSRFRYIMDHGYSASDVGKLEIRKPEAIKGPVGKLIGTPTRFLSAADQLAKSVVYAMKINGLAYREAKNANISADQFADAVADLVQNPTPGMIDEAAKVAKYRTYTQEMGVFGQSLKDLQGAVNVKGFRPLAYVIPFIPTPVNVAKFAAERGGVTGPIIGAIQAAGTKGVPRSEALARGSIAAVTGALMAFVAAEGRLTGPGPSNQKDKDLLLQQGWKPYSFKVGNTWISYQNMEPLSSILLQPALLYEQFKYDKNPPPAQQVSRFFAELAKSYSNQTFLTGVAQWLDAITAPQDKAKQYIQRFAGSFVPNLLSTVAGSVDRVARNPKSVPQELQSRIPFLSKQVPARTDSLDTPIVYDRAPGALGMLESFTPLNRSTEQPGAGQLREDANTAQLIRDLDKKLKNGEDVTGYPPELTEHLKAERLVKLIEAGDPAALQAAIDAGQVRKATVKKALELQKIYERKLTKEDARMLLYPPGLKRAQMFIDRYDAHGSSDSKNAYVTNLTDAGILDAVTLTYVKQIKAEQDRRKAIAGTP